MVPALHLELAAQRAADLRRAGDNQRRVRAARLHAGPSVRRRLGRGLVAVGAVVAGEAAAVDRLVPSRPHR